MTGPEHYQEAERLLKAVADLTPAVAEHDLRAIQERAQVHATLALAAATALGSLRTDGQGMPPEDDSDWVDACARGWDDTQ